MRKTVRLNNFFETGRTDQFTHLEQDRTQGIVSIHEKF